MGKPTRGVPTGGPVTKVISNASQFAGPRPAVNLAPGKKMPVVNQKAVASGKIPPTALFGSKGTSRRGR